MKNTRIVIAGGGPVGVISALACAQRGYAVTLLEAEAKVDDSPRAATTHPSTLEMIARVDLFDQFIQEGLVARYFQFWNKPERAKIVEFDHDVLRDALVAHIAEPQVCARHRAWNSAWRNKR